MYNIEAQFLQTLEGSGINSLSLRNYRSDIHFFGKFVRENYLNDKTSFVGDQEFSHAITPEVLAHYQTVLKDSYKGATVNRKLTTLKKFLRFLESQHLVQTSLVKEISLVGNIEGKRSKMMTHESVKQRVISNYKEYLSARRVTPHSQASYKSDIEQFLTWVIDK